MFCHLSADATLITGISQGPGLSLEKEKRKTQVVNTDDSLVVLGANWIIIH